jgi:hypothetical protein
LSTVPDKEIPSFEGLYKAHYLKVQRLCRMLLRDSAEAEETGQEVFLKMFKQYQTASWPVVERRLTRVTVNTATTGAIAWRKWWRSSSGEVQLADYRVSAHARAGSEASSKFSWHANRTLRTAARVFV